VRQASRSPPVGYRFGYRSGPIKDVFSLPHGGHLYRCDNESVNVSAAGPARPWNAQWHVSQDGVEVFQFPSAPANTEASVKRRLMSGPPPGSAGVGIGGYGPGIVIEGRFGWTSLDCWGP